MPHAVSIAAPAKINLFLRVLEQRADGYHDLDTLFAAVDVSDRLHVVRSAAGITLDVIGADLGDPRDNLVHKAAAAFLRAAGSSGGVTIHLEKRILAGGGLGGGSSDAAATLRCLDALFGQPLGQTELTEIAKGLGSDVPFFLSSSPFALGGGRGDELTPLPPLPPKPVLLVVPDESVGTGWAYGLLADARARSRRRNISTADMITTAEVLLADDEKPAARPRDPGELSSWAAVATLASNDFEGPVFKALPELERALDAVVETGPMLGLMSGSGSTMFGVYEDEGSADRARASIEDALPHARVHHARTLESFPAVEPE